MLGLWIDRLTDEERDKVVRQQAWYNPEETVKYSGEEKCLVQVVRGGRFLSDAYRVPSTRRYASRYDCLVARFGKVRIVRAIKLRAGASVEDLDATLTPEREAVEV